MPDPADPDANRLPSVLLVEDDEQLAELVVALLRPTADVTWARSGEAGLARIDEQDWDVIVSDIGLPGIDGLDFVRRARAVRPKIAVVMLSARTGFEDAVAAIRAGADDYLAKPLEPAALAAKVAMLVKLSRARRGIVRHRVLAIGAHPDDVEIGVGGILLNHVRDGDEVTILTLTGGEAGGEPGVRAKEAERAAAMIGARLIQDDLPDTTISVTDGGRTIGAIAEIVEAVEPDTVYTHTVLDVHQDHRNVHRATLVAARAVPRIFGYQAPSTTVAFQPNRFVAIDDVMERKLDVLATYASQSETRTYLAPDLIRATARYWSRFTRGLYVEPLEVERDSDAQGTVHVSGPEDDDDA